MNEESVASYRGGPCPLVVSLSVTIHYANGIETTNHRENSKAKRAHPQSKKSLAELQVHLGYRLGLSLMNFQKAGCDYQGMWLLDGMPS